MSALYDVFRKRRKLHYFLFCVLIHLDNQHTEDLVLHIEQESAPHLRTRKFKQETRYKVDQSFNLNVPTTYEERYFFKRAWNSIIAEIQALDLIPCTVSISIRTVQGCLVLDGTITTWVDSAAPVAKRAARAIEDVVSALNRSPGAFECSLDATLHPQFSILA